MHADRAAIGSAVFAGRAHVVLHVAAALHALGVQVAFELREDVAVGLAHHVGQHVQAPAMGHGDHGLPRALIRGDVENCAQRHDRRLGAFQAEPLLTHVARVQEALEDFRLAESLEDSVLLFERHRQIDALDALLDPALLHGVHDVAVLDANRATVRVAQDRQDLLEGGLASPGEPAHDEGPLQVPDRQSVRRQVELGMQRGCIAVQRIKVGVQVPSNPVHVDELLDTDLLEDAFVVPFAYGGEPVRTPRRARRTRRRRTRERRSGIPRRT